MTVWNHRLSWSKLILAESCQRRLQLTIDKAPRPFSGTGYHAAAGITSQKVFELYFNKGLNLQDGGRDPKVPVRILDKILETPFLEDMNVQYSNMENEEMLTEAIRGQVIGGFETLGAAGLLHKRVRSEVKVSAVFRNLGMFCMVDFIVDLGRDNEEIWDGKGNNNKDADDGQVLYYTLSRLASGKTVKRGGFLYWKHDHVEIDLSPRALKTFIDERLQPVKPLFDELKQGISRELPTSPSFQACKWCAWKNVCKDSYFRRDEITNPTRGETTL